MKPPSSKSRFKDVAKRILDFVEVILKGPNGQEPDADLHCEFWVSSRELTVEDAFSIIREFKDYGNREMWRTELRVRTRGGDWRPIHAVLLSDDIAPNDEGWGADDTVDTDFHEPDEQLLRALEVTTPRGSRNAAPPYGSVKPMPSVS